MLNHTSLASQDFCRLLALLVSEPVLRRGDLVPSAHRKNRIARGVKNHFNKASAVKQVLAHLNSHFYYLPDLIVVAGGCSQTDRRPSVDYQRTHVPAPILAVVHRPAVVGFGGCHRGPVQDGSTKQAPRLLTTWVTAKRDKRLQVPGAARRLWGDSHRADTDTLPPRGVERPISATF